MDESKGETVEIVERREVSALDCILLPAIGFLTVVLLVVLTEAIARRVFSAFTIGAPAPASIEGQNNFRPSAGFPVYWAKDPEGPLVKYGGNPCEDSAQLECRQKIPGVYRIVVAGTSTAAGYLVPHDESFARLLPAELLRQTGQTIQVYNSADYVRGDAKILDSKFDDFLKFRPDMLLWVLTSHDIQRGVRQTLKPELAKEWSAHLTRGLWGNIAVRVRSVNASGSLRTAVSNLFDASRTELMLRHLIYLSQSRYLDSYLAGEDSETGFLKSDYSPYWNSRVADFNSDTASILRQARARGVKVVVVFIPNRAQASMISMGQWPKGFDPYKMDNALRSAILSGGGSYLDIVPDYKDVSNPERGYFPVDGHPNQEGHALIAKLIARHLSQIPFTTAAPAAH